MELITFNAPELQAVGENKAEQIKATFEPMAEMLTEFEDVYNSVILEAKKEITKELTLKAKRIRLDIGKVRIETGKLKDKQKEYIKLEDKAIMGVHNILVWAVKEKEDNLKEIEDYFDIQEQKRLEWLQFERATALSEYVEDAHDRKLSEMEDDVWEAYYIAKKQEYIDRIAAEKKAEEERIAKEKAESEEREKMKIENDRLKREAEINKKRIEQEREKREAELEKEREAKRQIEHELQVKKDAEKKAEIERLAKIEDDLSKNDSAKIIDLKNDLTTLKTKYTFSSNKSQKMYLDVGVLLDKIIAHINNK